MTRTVLTSIAKTCHVCSTVNTIVAVTTEIRPSWRINCSKCGAAIRTDGIDPEAGAAVRPVVAAESPAGVRPDRKSVARRRRRSNSRCCKGLHMAAGAALGMIGTAFLLDGYAGRATVLTAATEPMVLTAVLDHGPRAGDLSSPAVPAGDQTAGGTKRIAETGANPRRAGMADGASGPGTMPDGETRLADGAAAPTPVDPEVAAAAEAALELSRRDRRQLQRRLMLAEHDPRLVDGIFGPDTRAAIAGWQRAEGLWPSGFIDATALALLERQTEDRYHAWLTAERARDRRRQRTEAVAVASKPETSGGTKCQRSWSGKIAYGQNVRCDFRGLRENVAKFFLASERS